MNIDSVKILGLLNDALNQQARVRKGTEAIYHCPFCSHHKNKLEINVTSQKWHCWVCGSGGFTIRSLFKKLNATREQYNRLYDITKDRRSNIQPKNDVKIENRRLPDTFIPLSDGLWGGKFASPHRKAAMRYLTSRGVSENDIFRYNIGYAEVGEYSGRVIVPSYDGEGRLNFFSSRAFYDSISAKHKTPEWDKDIIGFELFINWNEDISLVEGAFDAFAVRNNVIPLFGKNMSYALKEAVVRNGTNRVNVILDKDAFDESLAIQDFLTAHEIQCHLIKLDDKDPSVIGFEKISRMIKDSKPTDFRGLLTMKLFQ